ncbi:MAG: hypothetical protein CMK59_06555 [Proteobacteria bacterium]|nr:hypothetical protein [Pseudomonadota bacterium]
MSLNTLDIKRLFQALSAHCLTHQGTSLCLEQSLMANREKVNGAYRRLKEMMQLRSSEADLHLRQVTDYTALLDQLELGELLVFEDIYDLYQSLSALFELRKSILRNQKIAPMLSEDLLKVNADEAMFQILALSFDERGYVSERFYPKLGIYRVQKTEAEQAIQKELRRLIEDPAVIPMLQEVLYTVKNGRYVLPLKVHFKRSFGIVHARSQSGETVYVEPISILNLANRAREAELALEHELREIKIKLCRHLNQHRSVLKAFLVLSAELDLLHAKAVFAQNFDAHIPIVLNEGVVQVEGFRHPLLELQGKVVSNRLFLSSDNPAILLTGPNAGGKTVALKSFGLVAVMVRLGMAIPADSGSRVDFFDPIVVDLGDQQELESGLSTFAAHLLSLNRALEKSCRGALILLDEPGMGTDPSQGAALAQSLIESYVDSGARVVCTTHFVRLKMVSEVDPRFLVAAAQFEKGRPTYQLNWGEIGASHALDLARQLNIPPRILERAQKLMSAQELKLGQILNQLDAQRALNTEMNSKLRKKEEQIDKDAKRIERLEDRVLHLQKGRKDREHSVFLKRLEDLEDEAKGWVAELQKRPSSQLAGKTLKQIRGLLSEQRDKTHRVAAKSMGIDEKDILPGTTIRHSVWGVGTVLSRAKQKAHVQFSSLRVEVAIKEIEEVLESKSAPQNRASKRVEVLQKSVSLKGNSNSCDLRGERVDDALKSLESFLDSQMLSKVPTVFVLHGHGTGALKKAVRQWLKSCSYVRDWRPAEQHEGGDAWTVVELQ